jgi:putative transposase
MAYELIAGCCQKSGVSIQSLSGGSRLRQLSKVRGELSNRLAKELGLSLAETARLLGVSTSAVAKILIRRAESKSN